jgi:hypothetical protein
MAYQAAPNHHSGGVLPEIAWWQPESPPPLRTSGRGNTRQGGGRMCGTLYEHNRGCNTDAQPLVQTKPTAAYPNTASEPKKNTLNLFTWRTAKSQFHSEHPLPLSRRAP